MKNSIKVIALTALMSVPFSFNSANAVTVDTDTEVFAQCSIKVDGFSASGNCSSVLRAYRKFKQIQNS